MALPSQLSPLDNQHVFSYTGFSVEGNKISCAYSVSGYEFTERFSLDGDLDSSLGRSAARLLFLVAGVSYYKAVPTRCIDLGGMEVTRQEVEFLRSYYIGGLGEFSYVNKLSLGDLEIVGYTELDRLPSQVGDESINLSGTLIPFGGGIDSIVTTEQIRQQTTDAKLFIMSPRGAQHKVIEVVAGITDLDVLRADRQLDSKIFQSEELGFKNGHVPVTAITAALAICVAVANGIGEVVMSNEKSSSVPNLEFDGRQINHQYSKSAEFEESFSQVVTEALGGQVRWYSYLRDRSELWVAQQFSAYTHYHDTFRSCNKAFRISTEERLSEWCGVCEKCCFIDLILSPFLGADQLRRIFGAMEPLENPNLVDDFKALVSTKPGFSKPFECVGDIDECRQAVKLAIQRPDRFQCETLAILAQAIVEETK